MPFVAHRDRSRRRSNSARHDYGPFRRAFSGTHRLALRTMPSCRAPRAIAPPLGSAPARQPPVSRVFPGLNAACAPHERRVAASLPGPRWSPSPAPRQWAPELPMRVQAHAQQITPATAHQRSMADILSHRSVYRWSMLLGDGSPWDLHFVALAGLLIRAGQ